MSNVNECRRRALALLLALGLGACAVSVAYAATPGATKSSEHTDADDQTYVDTDSDPLEPFNRVIYGFNHIFDKVVLRPVTQAYRYVVPEYGRTMFDNFVTNLYTPVVFTNSVLQGDPKNSFSTFFRFVINTTIGVGGMFDVASEAGLHNRNADLGETMAFYGVGPGPYLVIPVIGPSNVRDAFGRLGDAFMTPTNYATDWFKGGQGYEIEYGVWAATAIDERSKNMKLIDEIYANSLDPYSTFRSGYTQKRASDIRRAKAARDKALAAAMCK